MVSTQTNIELQSILRADGSVELALTEIPMPEPGDNEIVVEVQATPLNPSDMSLLLARADAATAQSVTQDGRTFTVLQTSQPAALAQRGRWDLPIASGNEGAGLVVAAGAGQEAQALIGRHVAVVGGSMYVKYRRVAVSDSMLLPDDVTPAEGAAAHINPLTALGMVETMRDEGFTALVHTAAASNLGQMLTKLCLAEGIELVNIVRSPEQSAILKAIGAGHVHDLSQPDFLDGLIGSLRTTGARLAFDAVGGGQLASQILFAMDQAFKAEDGPFNFYGSDLMKKVYLYGLLDTGPTQLLKNYGMAWSVGGWLLFHFLKRVGPERTAQLKARIAGELKTTFASHYTRTISLAEATDPAILQAASKRATGEKYLINPAL